MPTPIPSASNSCAREKLASVIFDLASASAPCSESASRSLTTRDDQRDLARLVLADRGVAAITCAISCDSTEASSEESLASAIKPAGHVKLPARQRKGVDRRRIEDGDAVALVRPVGGRHELLDRLVDQRLEARILVGAVIGGEDALVLALRRRREFRRRCRLGAGRAATPWFGRDRGGAAAKQQTEQERGRAAPARLDCDVLAMSIPRSRRFCQFSSAISICSG